MKKSQIQSVRDKKKNKRDKWKPNMYCIQWVHTLKNGGRPIRITREMYNRKKQCHNNKCEYIFIDEKKVGKHGWQK